MSKKQQYKYIKEKSILNTNDDYDFSSDEYKKLYSFFVEYSVCKGQSFHERKFVDYGWSSNNIVENIDGKNTLTDIGRCLKSILNFDGKDTLFVFTDENNLKSMFEKYELRDGELLNYDTQRCVITKTNESNKYLKLFHRIRDGLAHGKIRRKLSSNKDKMIVVQDDDGHNVTARIVIRLDILLSFVDKIQERSTF